MSHKKTPLFGTVIVISALAGCSGATPVSGPGGSSAGGASGAAVGGAPSASAGGASHGVAGSSVGLGGGTSNTGGGGTNSGGVPSAIGGNASGGTNALGGTAGRAPTGGAGGASAGGAPASGGTGGSVFPPGVTRPRIMIVGDSISAGPGCYKKYLVQNLTANRITNYEFVGQYTDDCGGGVKHSAVSCTTSGQYTQATFTVPNCFGTTSFPGMSTLVQTHDPDLIMVQLGVNDVWSGNAPIEPILANYATLVNQARAHNPNVVVIVAQIHKIITDTCTNAASTTNAERLGMAVPAWAQRVTTAQSPVLVADLWTNSDPHESADCVHPNDAGAQRMGLNWYNALKGILK
jgi:GDSL-like Lipase/Acylhydrolase family